MPETGHILHTRGKNRAESHPLKGCKSRAGTVWSLAIAEWFVLTAYFYEEAWFAQHRTASVGLTTPTLVGGQLFLSWGRSEMWGHLPTDTQLTKCLSSHLSTLPLPRAKVISPEGHFRNGSQCRKCRCGAHLSPLPFLCLFLWTEV